MAHRDTGVHTIKWTQKHKTFGFKTKEMQKPRQKYTLEFKQKAVELSNKYYGTIRTAEKVNR
ncbi:hypothetical protein [Flavobacterium sp. B183]|jgi:hypothetical protein|uniref:hypothetical protein n=1 Tax=Flavobacterium sp. B183 TaxID=907046 RepID=UPI00201F5F3E|nr:hypothetical protein [Flavobacterium sp. B183]URC11718.1 hypothetical protein M4I44_16660 [Flavobacterium sp. B183]